MSDVNLINGDAVLQSAYITGDDLVLQRIDVRFRMFLGEGLLDTSLGLPYAEIVSNHKLDILAIGSQIRRLILETPGVGGIRSFNVSAASRKLSVSCVVLLPSGGTAAISVQSGREGLYNVPYTILFHRGV